MVRVWFRTLSGATMGARVPEACTGADLCGVLGRALGEPQPCGVRLFADGRCIAATDVVRPRADQAFLAVLSVTSLVGDVLGRRPAPAGVPFVAAAARHGCTPALRAACERIQRAEGDDSAAYAAATILLDALSDPEAVAEALACSSVAAGSRARDEAGDEVEDETHLEAHSGAHSGAESSDPELFHSGRSTGGDRDLMEEASSEAVSRAGSGSDNDGEGGRGSDGEGEGRGGSSTRSLMRALEHLMHSDRSGGEDDEDDHSDDGDGDAGGAAEAAAAVVERARRRYERRQRLGLPYLPSEERLSFLEHMLMSEAAAREREREREHEHDGHSGDDSGDSSRDRDSRDRGDEGRDSGRSRMGDESIYGMLPRHGFSTHRRLVRRVHQLARAARARGAPLADPRARARVAPPAELVEQLVSVMGDGSERRVRRALRLARMNPEAALNMLLDGDPRLDGGDDDDDGDDGSSGSSAFSPETSDADAEALLVHSEDVRRAVSSAHFEDALACVEADEPPAPDNSDLLEAFLRIRRVLRSH